MIELSVVLPTYNAAARLRLALRSLDRSELDHGLYEVVVVDDGSTDGTAAAVSEFAASSSMNVSYFRRERDVTFGPGIARDEAMRRASGHIIVFFDDDCTVGPEWLGRIYGYLKDGTRAAVAVKVTCPETLVFPWKIAPAGHTGFLAFDRRVTGERHFSPEFIGKCGDDTDFIFRLADDGFKIDRPGDLEVVHPPNVLDLRRVWRSAWSRGNEVLLHKKYGRRAGTDMHWLFRPVFFGRLSPLFVALAATLVITAVLIIYFGAMGAAAAAAAAALVGASFLVFGYRYCLTNVQPGFRLSFSDRLRTLAAVLIYFPAHLYARAAASVRHRHLML